MSALDDDYPGELDVYGDGCCALVKDHDGCCAHHCSMCQGRGRTCYPDDLGCDCGVCDGVGYCSECSGEGWFNEFGESIPQPHWSEIAAFGTCDWGGCNEPAERFRWSEDDNVPLPVCAAHAPPPAPSYGDPRP